MPFHFFLVLGAISGILLFLAVGTILYYRKKNVPASFWMPTIFATLLLYFFSTEPISNILFGRMSEIDFSNPGKLLVSLPAYITGIFGIFYLFRWLRKTSFHSAVPFVLPLSVSIAFGIQTGMASSFLSAILPFFSFSRVLHGILYIGMIYLYFSRGPVRDYFEAVKHGLLIGLFSTSFWVIRFYLSLLESDSSIYLSWLTLIGVNLGIAIVFPVIIMFLLKSGHTGEPTQKSEDEMFQ